MTAIASTPVRSFIDARAHAQFDGTSATQDEVTAWYFGQVYDHDGAVKLAAEFMDEVAPVRATIG